MIVSLIYVFYRHLMYIFKPKSNLIFLANEKAAWIHKSWESDVAKEVMLPADIKNVFFLFLVSAHTLRKESLRQIKGSFTIW